jgi:hypothetical protein
LTRRGVCAGTSPTETNSDQKRSPTPIRHTGAREFMPLHTPSSLTLRSSWWHGGHVRGKAYHVKKMTGARAVDNLVEFTPNRSACPGTVYYTCCTERCQLDDLGRQPLSHVDTVNKYKGRKIPLHTHTSYLCFLFILYINTCRDRKLSRVHDHNNHQLVCLACTNSIVGTTR